MDAVQENISQQFDLFGCFQCGKCTGGCPVSLKSKLNIRRLVLKGLLNHYQEPMAGMEELWDCTTCKTCTLRCPRGIKPMDLVIGMRSMLVEEGQIPETLMNALESVYKHGNPWGKPKSRRKDWTKELHGNIAVKDFCQGQQAEYLYFVGCTVSFDPRTQAIARAVAFNLQQGNVDFGILGNEEQCCGSEIRSLGEFGLFEELATANSGLFTTFQIRNIITSCPHGFNVLKNEYPQRNFEVFHSTQVLARCLGEGKLSFLREIHKTVTYHDPCFLGKQNGVYDEPRFLLQAIPGLTLREFDRSRERSLCCEGGGGRMWAETASANNVRLAQIRVRDAAELGAEILVTACPLCVLTLEDAVKTTGLEERLLVMDVMELLAVALGRADERV
jgi:Fe-S oxidoreductase